MYLLNTNLEQATSSTSGISSTDLIAIIALIVSVIALIPSIITFSRSFTRMKAFLVGPFLTKNGYGLKSNLGLLIINKSSRPVSIASVYVQNLMIKGFPLTIPPFETKIIPIDIDLDYYTGVVTTKINTTTKCFTIKTLAEENIYYEN